MLDYNLHCSNCKDLHTDEIVRRHARKFGRGFRTEDEEGGGGGFYRSGGPIYNPRNFVSKVNALKHENQSLGEGIQRARGTGGKGKGRV